MIYELIQMLPDGRLMPTSFTENNVIPAMSVRGYEMTGQETRKGLRPELQGHPRFGGVLGPMWGGVRDGVPVIRYETQSVNDHLSV
jgi:hypothetical protein